MGCSNSNQYISNSTVSLTPSLSLIFILAPRSTNSLIVYSLPTLAAVCKGVCWEERENTLLMSLWRKHCTSDWCIFCFHFCFQFPFPVSISIPFSAFQYSLWIHFTYTFPQFSTLAHCTNTRLVSIDSSLSSVFVHSTDTDMYSHCLGICFAILAILFSHTVKVVGGASKLSFWSKGKNEHWVVSKRDVVIPSVTKQSWKLVWVWHTNVSSCV